MSRFGNDYDGDGIPWGLWEAIVRNALAGRRGQTRQRAGEWIAELHGGAVPHGV